MGLRSWSKKIRQQDYSLQWIISTAKESDDATGTHTIDVLLNSDVLESGITVNKSINELSEFNEQFNAIMEVSSETTNGQVNRGLHNMTKPTVSNTPNPQAFDLSSFYRLVVKNTGTAPIVVTSLYATLRKLYPGETLVAPESHDAGTDPADVTAFNAIYQELEDPLSPHAAYLSVSEALPASFPSNLTALFSGLSASSTSAEIDAVINSTEFRDYYKNVAPRSLVMPKGTIGRLSDSGLVAADLPIVLQPNERAAFGFTRHVAGYFYTPIDLD